MGSTRPHRVRYTALRAVCGAREQLASITSASMPQGIDAQLLNELSCALLTAVRPHNENKTHHTGHDTSFHLDRDYCYLRLIYALIKNDEWYQRLTHDGHLDRCISLFDEVCKQRYSMIGSCLLVIFGCIKSSDHHLPFSLAEEKYRLLFTDAWDYAQYHVEHDAVDRIPAFVTVTRHTLTTSHYSVPREWLVDLTAKVHCALFSLQRGQANCVDRGIAQAAIDTALSSMQGLYDDLHRMVKQ
ncbi:hypothetical protein BDR07DRAFT_317339 [Suillus spraguei]|nr:hypothetical protein BDR07DRAFT_317339 [Suillus spraguei]